MLVALSGRGRTLSTARLAVVRCRRLAAWLWSGGVDRVASWLAVRIHPTRRIERRLAVDHGHCPLAAVDQCVVVAAEQHGVVDGGLASVGPVLDVVVVAVSGWSAAAGESAA